MTHGFTCRKILDDINCVHYRYRKRQKLYDTDLLVERIWMTLIVFIIVIKTTENIFTSNMQAFISLEAPKSNEKQYATRQQ